MAQVDFIAVIDFGSSQIRCVIAKKNENNIISVIDHHAVDAENSVRRGLIYNVDKAASLVKKLINSVHNKLGSPRIAKAYVSLGGQSVYVENVSEVLHLPDSGIVTEKMIGQLRSKALAYKPELKQNYGVADVEYFLDEKSEQSPVGVSCATIAGEYKVVVGRPNLYSNIENVMKKCQLEIAGYVVSPLASADISLERQDKKLGCAFIDFGDGTTDLSVYKGGILRHLITIPFGSRNITKDIAELNFLEEEAEQYKKKFGKARDSSEKSMFTSPFSAKPDIDLKELNKVIVYRLDEITANIKEQIRLSGYQDQLGAGAIITGGGSHLKNIESYLSQKLNMEIRKASARKSVVNNAPDLAANPAYTAVLGMLLHADVDCERIVVQEDPDTESSDSAEKSGAKSWGRGIFGRQTKNNAPKIEKTKSEEQNIEKEKSSGIGDKVKDFFGGLFEDESEYED